MSDNMILYNVASLALLPASARTLSLILDDIMEGKKVDGLTGVTKPKSHVVKPEEETRFKPTPTHISEKLFAALIKSGLIALDENKPNPIAKPVQREESEPMAWSKKEKPLQIA